MTLLRAQLRDLVVAQLISANTSAGTNVFVGRDWPTSLTFLPAILVQTPHERKESLGRQGAPQFTTVADLVVVGRVSADTAIDAEAAVEALDEQIELAILANASVTQYIQQFTFVETATGINSSGATHIGEVAMTFGCELYQFYTPAMGPPLQQVQITAAADGTITTDGTVTLQIGTVTGTLG